MYEFNIGDRVICIVDHPAGNPTIVAGYTGTVCDTGSGIGVCWDEPVEGGHDCGVSDCKYGHGWWVHLSDVEPKFDDDTKPFEFDEDEFNKLVFGE